MMTTRSIVSVARLTILATTLSFKLQDKRASLASAAEKQTAARKIEMKIDSAIKDDIDLHKHKRTAASVVCEIYVKPNSVIGIGAGPATYWVIEEIGALLKKGAVNVSGVRIIPVNSNIERHCTALHIPTTHLSSIDVDSPVDLLIDGADEVDLSLNVLKGNSGSLIREKMLWHSALQRVVLVTEESKMVKKLGLTCPLAVEVSSWGDEYLKGLLVKVLPETRSARGVMRSGTVSNHYSDGLRVATTDGGNHIVDLYFSAPIQDPQTLSMALDSLPGVMGHGLFVGYATTVVYADDKGVRIVGHAGEGQHPHMPENPWWDWDKPFPRPFETETVDNRKI